MIVTSWELREGREEGEGEDGGQGRKLRRKRLEGRWGWGELEQRTECAAEAREPPGQGRWERKRHRH